MRFNKQGLLNIVAYKRPLQLKTSRFSNVMLAFKKKESSFAKRKLGWPQAIANRGHFDYVRMKVTSVG